MPVQQPGNLAQLTALRERGWELGASFDYCWLDCEQPGFRKVDRSQEICLCLPHAQLLEEGVWAGDYTGAPLPPDSMAVEWPWGLLAPAA